MKTYRIVEALDTPTGRERYWVFVVDSGQTRMVVSNVPRRRALTTVFDQCTDEDIVECVQTSGLLREEFGSEFRSRLAPYLIPHE